MNERIDEFIGYAKFMAEETTKRQISLNTELRTFSKFFAELIVKECAEQIKTHGISASSEDYGDYEIGFNAGLFHALRTTKEHFGVEE